MFRPFLRSSTCTISSRNIGLIPGFFPSSVSFFRLASVYKPERRKALQDMGYTLVGGMGDQFSDLSGLYSTAAGWKLPNPVYAII